MKHLQLLLCGLLFTAVLFANDPKVILFPNGNKHFEYEVKNNLFNGSFTSYFENGKMRMKGGFTNNQKTGVWTTWDENGIIRSQRKYTDDYTFEIINEWDASGTAEDPAIIRQKNQRIAESRSTHSDNFSYLHRFWKTIPADNTSNDFLFANNTFFHFMLDLVSANKLQAFSDDRLVNHLKDFAPECYKDMKVVEFRVKEDHYYWNEQGIMANRLISISPVIIINGEKKQVGWFYVTDINNNAPTAIKEIVSKLKNIHYSGTITKTSVNLAKNTGYSENEVLPSQNDAIVLSSLDYEAGAWIFFMEKEKVKGK